jgi:capsular polysaccharide biosynthesis protein
MPYSDILRIVRRRGWIVVLLVALTAAAAFGFSKTQNTLYLSTVEVLIQPERTDFGLAQTAKILLGNYTAFIDSERIAARVLDDLKIDQTPEALKSTVTIASDIDRLVISINVKNPDGGQANDIARAWAQELVDWRNLQNQALRKEDRIDAVIRDEPKDSLYQPQTRINVVAGAVLGLLLGAALVFALEWLESGIVRSAADAERALGVTVLGAIPRTARGASGGRGLRGLMGLGAAPAERRPA